MEMAYDVQIDDNLLLVLLLVYITLYLIINFLQTHLVYNVYVVIMKMKLQKKFQDIDAMFHNIADVLKVDVFTFPGKKYSNNLCQALWSAI